MERWGTPDKSRPKVVACVVRAYCLRVNRSKTVLSFVVRASRAFLKVRVGPVGVFVVTIGFSRLAISSNLYFNNAPNWLSYIISD